MKNIFKNVKFGDKFLTSNNKKAIFLRFADNFENEFAMFYVEDYGIVQTFRENGKEVHGDDKYDIVSIEESLLPYNIDEAAIIAVRNACGDKLDTDEDIKIKYASFINAFKSGSEWCSAKNIIKIPRNLDEAAKKYGEENPILPDRYNDGDLELYQQWTSDVFKAGADWLAKQGETHETLVFRDEDDDLFVQAFLESGKFKMADNVVLQIRKK